VKKSKKKSKKKAKKKANRLSAKLLPPCEKKREKRILTYRPPLPTGNGDYKEVCACVDYVEEDTCPFQISEK